MVSEVLNTTGLRDLGSQEHLDLLDSVDYLRSQGISHYVSLPQIIVCGDQSSGKSATLEAISGVSFPVKSNLCTRFPTELILRKSPDINVSISIVPDQERSESERLSLSTFHETLIDFAGLPSLVEQAKAAMGISTHGKAFAKDLLRIEISGPDRPHLTIVDLPGLIHSQTKQQSESDVVLVQEVVQGYMKASRSIILAVVSAKNDYANQVVLKLARSADPSGERTLGVITKPDTLISRSESEASYVSLARNQDVEFRLGWHVLKNMDTETGQWTLAHRDSEESDFFDKGRWSDLPKALVGVDSLRHRLSKVLYGQIAAELPSLMNEIGIKIDVCQDRLAKLGEPRATLDEQRMYLFRASQSFQSLIKAAVDGTYNDPFFGSAKSEAGYHKRIRAVTQNLNEDFAESMSRRGHSQQIVDSIEHAVVARGVTAITRIDFIEQIKHLMQRTRGRELPGTFNPMIVWDLFVEQAAPWETIARDHVMKICAAFKRFLRLVIKAISDPATSNMLFQKIIEPALVKLQTDLSLKITELIQPHQTGHPITYNHYFTETVQAVREDRKKTKHEKTLKSFFNVSVLGPHYISQMIDLKQLSMSLIDDTESDMKKFACSEALDCMEAYYKVSRKRFVDDVAVEGIEVVLISALSDIFSPVAVSSMTSDLVTQIAGESEEKRSVREQLSKQLEVLRMGYDTCERYVDQRLLETDHGSIETPDEQSSDTGDDEIFGSSSHSSPQVLTVEDIEEVEPLADDGGAQKPFSPDSGLGEPPAAAEVFPEKEAVEDTWGFAPKRSKKDKKSRIAAARAMWEE